VTTSSIQHPSPTPPVTRAATATPAQNTPFGRGMTTTPTGPFDLELCLGWPCSTGCQGGQSRDSRRVTSCGRTVPAWPIIFALQSYGGICSGLLQLITE